MKEAYVTDLNGYYIEPTLVADHVTGVFPIQEPVPDTDELEPMEEAEEPQEPETVLAGYTVAVPVPAGLYKPRFDLEAWKAAEAQYEQDLEAWRREQQSQEEDEAKPLPQPVDLAQFWIEGLTQEEIDFIRNRPTPKAPIEVLKEQNTQLLISSAQTHKQVQNMQTQNTQLLLQNAQLSQENKHQQLQLSQLLIEIAQLKGGK